MQWGYLLLALSGCFAGGISLYLHRQTDRLKFLGFFWAAFFFVLMDIGIILQPVLLDDISSFIINQIVEWGHIYCIALILSSLLLFVRESKPEFSRFPVAYVTFPLLIIISYLLVYNTVVLKEWLISIYHAGAISVALLMYGIYSYREPIYRTVFIGVVGFLLTFIIHILLSESYQIVWQILLAISITVTFSGFYLIKHHFERVIEDT